MADFSKPILKRSVQRAREILQKEAESIVEQHLQTIDLAIADEQYEFALEAQRWLIEHIADDDGVRVVDASVDKKQDQTKLVGPQVNIGIALGGIPQPQLQQAPNSPTPILEAKVEPYTSLPPPSDKPDPSQS